METYVAPVTDNLIDIITAHVKKKRNREKIMKTIIEPVLEDINRKYYPHYITLISLFIMMILMLITLLFVSFWIKK
jgi:hypothetical protein